MGSSTNTPPSDNDIIKAVAGACVVFSFILVGNAITQSFMTIPALLVDFPHPNSPDHTARARLLGRQWPLCWTVGNRFFRPITTLGFLGYAYCGYTIHNKSVQTHDNWPPFVAAAALHLAIVIHSMVNMQPLSEQIEALAERTSEKELGEAVMIAQRWASWNMVRLALPLLAGVLVLLQIVK